tara:strand:+ start:3123 stop:3314 length:192 start_codon:yes stop_codon:yes gene_type:complete
MGVEMVSTCCGDEWEDIENEYGDYFIVCIACGNYCETTEDYEYRQWKLDERAEAMAEDKKLGL